MTNTRVVSHSFEIRALLIGVLALAPLATACAWQSTQSAQSAAQQFQQTAQQQQVSDQLQKSQLEQQLHQSVSDNAKRPTAGSPRTQQQLDAADRAQRERDRASQQDLLNRERDAAKLPRVVPKDLPAPTHSG
jgi:ABC-type transporter MlaC component